MESVAITNKRTSNVTSLRCSAGRKSQALLKLTGLNFTTHSWLYCPQSRAWWPIPLEFTWLNSVVAPACVYHLLLTYAVAGSCGYLARKLYVVWSVVRGACDVKRCTYVIKQQLLTRRWRSEECRMKLVRHSLKSWFISLGWRQQRFSTPQHDKSRLSSDCSATRFAVKRMSCTRA